MKKLFKKSLAVIMVVVITLTAAPLGGFVGVDLFSGLFDFKAEAASYSGTCGDNITWTLDIETGVLKITGEGAMTDWSEFSSASWISYRDYIKFVSIGDNITTIGSFAFKKCNNLTSIIIPKGIISIGDHAFEECYNLESIKVDLANKHYSSDSYGVLFNKDKTKLIYYPKGSTNKEYIIPDSVIYIDSSAFSYCYRLTSVTIGDNVTTISDYAFCNCENLTYITIGKSVTTIGQHAFANCSSLTKIMLPNGLKNIGDCTFVGCDNLTNITFPDSVISLGGSLFDKFANIESVTIGNGIESIPMYLLQPKVKTVTIGSGVKNIERDVFLNSWSLSIIKVDANNKYFSSDSYGVLFNKDKTELVRYPLDNTRASYIIPDSVITIGENALDRSSNLKNVIIGNKVKTIEKGAFFYCENLDSLTIPDSVTNIGSGAFYVCDSLKDVYFTGTQEQWKAISKEGNNGPLLKATIHYNSTGPDDNTSGNEPSDEEKYKNATISLDKDSYIVKEPDLLKITGTISCPNGVDGLLMSWSFDDTDAFYTASQTTYETVSETEKHFSVNFSPKKAGKFKIYAVLPNGAKTECTVESYKSCAPAYITEHLQFIESNEYNNFLNSKTAENLADSMRSNPSYHWNNAVSMNFFENYYDIVLAELLTGATTQKTMLETFYGAWSKECTGLLKEVFDFLDSSGKVNFENVTFEEFLDVFNTNNPDAYKNTTIYKMVVDAVGNDHTKIVNAVFKTSDIIGVAGDIFSASLDVYDGIRECVYYFSAINAYRYTSEYFKDVIQKASELTDNSDLKESLDTYASIDSKTDYIDFAKSLYERAKNSTIQTAVKIYFDLFGIGRTAKFVTNIMLKGGTKLASKVVTVSTKAGSFTATVAQYANAAISGVTLGMAVSEIITNSNDYCDYASKCTHAGDFAEVFANVLKEFENNFTKSQTIEDALRFDAAFNLYKGTQIYALTSIVQSVNAQENSLVAKIFNLKGNIASYISKINCYLNLRCHEHELDELVTGEYYFIDEKYSGNKVIRVACPVDVYVYDSAENLAASIENDFVEIFDDRLNAYVLNSEKYICVPLDEEFTIKIVSTDDGEMDYSVFEFDENSEMTREVSKENISLETNKTFDGKINNILNTDADNYNLTVSDTQEKITMENDINCIPATDIEVSESTISLKTGQSKTLYATVSPSNTTDKFAWISSDETVATVSENGTVKAVNAGKATIIAMVNDILYANCEITVDELKNYTVNWIVDGVTTQQTVKEGDAIIKPADPEKTCFRFIGWTPYVPSTMPANNLTFTAQFELATQLEIKTPSTTTINYGDTLVLHADLGETALPEGYSIFWTVEGTGVNITPGEDGLTCEVTSVQKGDVTVKATVVDENGEVITDADGNEISATQQLKSNVTFWQKIVSFFKNLFRISRIILQSK